MRPGSFKAIASEISSAPVETTSIVPVPELPSVTMAVSNTLAAMLDERRQTNGNPR